MRNFKKVIAVVVTLVMLLGVMAIGASADATNPKISLVGFSSTGLTDGAAAYYDVQVKLADADKAVGGIEGVITYDATVFEYVDAVLGGTFDDNNTVDNSIAATPGSIKFVGLATGDGVWFTLKFKVLKVAETEIKFAEGLKGAKVDGSNYIDVDTANLSVSVVDDNIVSVGGAAIKLVDTPDAQDIMFQALVNAEALAAKYPDAKVTKIGALMGIKQKLEGVELVANMVNDYVIDANTEHDKAENFAINLNNMTKNLVGVKIVSRAYIVLDNGVTVYSNNYNKDFDVVNGCGRRSVLQVATLAVELLLEKGAPNTQYEGTGIKEIFESDDIPMTDDFKAFVFKYIKDNKEFFPA